MTLFNDRRPTIPAEKRVNYGWAAKWHGGSSYSEPGEDHLEHFPTMGAAKSAFTQRRYGGDRSKQSVQGLNVDHTGAVSLGESRSAYMPAVDESSYMDVHPIKKDGTYDPDVFHRLQFGKRGGVTRSGL